MQFPTSPHIPSRIRVTGLVSEGNVSSRRGRQSQTFSYAGKVVSLARVRVRVRARDARARRCASAQKCGLSSGALQNTRDTGVFVHSDLRGTLPGAGYAGLG